MPTSTVPLRSHRAALELEHVAVVGDEDARRIDAHRLGEARVRGEHAPLAVHGDERDFGWHEREHRLQLVGRAVARDVHGRDVLVQHGRACAGQRVHGVGHGELVPRHGLGRHDHDVARLDRDDRVVAEGHARERRERLALRAGAQDRHLARGEVGEPPGLDERALGDVGVAEVAGDVEVPHHRAADHADLAPAPLGGVDHLLQPVDVRGERRHDHAARRVADDAAERGGDDLLALGHALALGVRRVGQQQREAVLAEPRELREIGALAVDRRVVDLEVARVQDRALVGVQRDGDGVGDRVRDADELGLERADLHRLAARVDLDQLRVVAHAVLVELRLDQAERQPRAPDLGHADLAHEVRQRADVILVAVRQDDRSQRAGRIAQVAEVGQHEVDAQHLVAREAETRVDQDPLAILLDHGHVLADLAETAEGDDANDADVIAWPSRPHRP